MELEYIYLNEGQEASVLHGLFSVFCQAFWHK